MIWGARSSGQHYTTSSLCSNNGKCFPPSVLQTQCYSLTGRLGFNLWEVELFPTSLVKFAKQAMEERSEGPSEVMRPSWALWCDTAAWKWQRGDFFSPAGLACGKAQYCDTSQLGQGRAAQSDGDEKACKDCLHYTGCPTSLQESTYRCLEDLSVCKPVLPKSFFLKRCWGSAVAYTVFLPGVCASRVSWGHLAICIKGVNLLSHTIWAESHQQSTVQHGQQKQAEIQMHPNKLYCTSKHVKMKSIYFSSWSSSMQTWNSWVDRHGIV